MKDRSTLKRVVAARVGFVLDPQTRDELDRLTDTLAAVVGHQLES